MWSISYVHTNCNGEPAEACFSATFAMQKNSVFPDGETESWGTFCNPRRPDGRLLSNSERLMLFREEVDDFSGDVAVEAGDDHERADSDLASVRNDFKTYRMCTRERFQSHVYSAPTVTFTCLLNERIEIRMRRHDGMKT